jgi:hypothetical protein
LLGIAELDRKIASDAESHVLDQSSSMFSTIILSNIYSHCTQNHDFICRLELSKLNFVRAFASPTESHTIETSFHPSSHCEHGLTLVRPQVRKALKHNSEHHAMQVTMLGGWS